MMASDQLDPNCPLRLSLEALEGPRKQAPVVVGVSLAVMKPCEQRRVGKDRAHFVSVSI